MRDVEPSDDLDCFTDGADDSSHMRNLLAIIHGDGGHHTEAVGIARSCRAAAAKWYRLCEDLETQERVTAALGDLARATINALRGEPPRLTTWSTHDMPDVARAVRDERDALRARVAEQERLAAGPSTTETVAMTPADIETWGRALG